MSVMILKTKLNSKAYKQADHEKWVAGDKTGIDPIVLGRLAYFGYKHNTVIVITQGGGFRSYAEQEHMYSLYLAGKLPATAAKPGTSRHGFSLAFDSSTPCYRSATSEEMRKYGLHKPIKNEPWHGEPVETIGKSLAGIKNIAPLDLAPALKKKFDLQENTMAFIAAYKYALPLTEGLLAGQKKFEKVTIDYLSTYKYWDVLKKDLGIQ